MNWRGMQKKLLCCASWKDKIREADSVSVSLILWNISDFFVITEFGEYLLDSFHWIQKLTDGIVMVQSINDKSNELDRKSVV